MTDSARYQDIRQGLKTGDLVLFNGKGLFSGVIQFGQRLVAGFSASESQWSHVGTVVVRQEYDEVMLFESTTLSDTPDTVTGNIEAGVMLSPLSTRLQQFRGDAVAVRSIEAARPPGFEKRLAEFRRAVHLAPYEKNVFELVGSVFADTISFLDDDASSLFCSELVAYQCKLAGWLPQEPPANDYCPASFASNRAPWCKGVTLGPVIRLSL